MQIGLHPFPNPVTNKLTIVSTYANPVQIQLLDMMGRRLNQAQKITGTYEMDVTRFAQNSYILLVTDTKKNKTFRKLVVKLK